MTPETLSIKNVTTVKRRSGLSAEKGVKRVPAGRALPNSTGRIDSLRVSTSLGYGLPLQPLVQRGIVDPKIERNTSWAAATLPLVNAV
jgi:hypothetical protein